MIGSDPKNAKMAALFLLGVALFNPPLLDIFDVGGTHTVGGIPLLYFYLFLSWMVLIGLMALVVERRPNRTDQRTTFTARPDNGD